MRLEDMTTGELVELCEMADVSLSSGRRWLADSGRVHRNTHHRLEHAAVEMGFDVEGVDEGVDDEPDAA